MAWISRSSPTPTYAEEQLSHQISALATLPVTLSSSNTFAANSSSSSVDPNLAEALHKLSSTTAVSRNELVSVLQSLSKDKKGQMSSLSSLGDEAVEAEILGRAVTMVWKEVIQALIGSALKLEEEKNWWTSTVASRRQVMYYLLQTLPERIYKAIESQTYSLSFRSFQLPSRQILFRPLPNASTALTSITSPYTLTRREMLNSIKSLSQSKDSMAIRIGILASECPNWYNVHSTGSNEYHSEISRIYSSLCSVLEIPIGPATPKKGGSNSKTHGNSYNISTSSTSSTGQFVSTNASPSSLLSILTVHLPKLQESTQSTLHKHGRPKLIVRIWFPMLFLPPVLLIGGRMLSRNKKWFAEQIKNSRETIKGFFVGWVWEPLEGVAKTLRGGGEGLNVSETTVKSDQESLERMVLDLGKNYYRMQEPQLSELRDKVASGEMDAVLRVYEKEMQSPLRNALMGNLIQTLLIQVQKTKTDLSLSLLSLDHLLRSQQLTFAFVGLAPSLLVLYGIAGWLRGVYRGEKRGKSRRKTYFDGIREIERILLTAPKQFEDLPDRDRGLLIVSVTGLRTWSAGLRTRQKNGFLEDLRLIEDTKLTRGHKLRVVERIWRCWGIDGRGGI